ncbi:hypothetical protein [Kitasatospora sp. NPDC087315]|uniref:hypothetical protein n=1 Tax=Kitasatospora sp. NPDC087315 TaxID=3364069 RepID=UPI00381277D4
MRDVIDEWMEVPAFASGMSLVVHTGCGPVRLSPSEAREALYRTQPSVSLRRSIWRQAILSARQEGAEQGATHGMPWRLLVVWLVLPGLSRTIRHVCERFRASRVDVEAEAMLAVLEALETVDPERPTAGHDLIKFARNRAWSYASRVSREVPAADVRAVAAAPFAHRSVDEEVAAVQGWELHIAPPNRPEGLCAPLRFTVSPRRVEGERLGSLAERLGLRDVVFRARRPGEGSLIGTLSLHRAGAGR